MASVAFGGRADRIAARTLFKATRVGSGRPARYSSTIFGATLIASLPLRRPPRIDQSCERPAARSSGPSQKVRHAARIARMYSSHRARRSRQSAQANRCSSAGAVAAAANRPTLSASRWASKMCRVFISDVDVHYAPASALWQLGVLLELRETLRNQ